MSRCADTGVPARRGPLSCLAYRLTFPHPSLFMGDPGQVPGGAEGSESQIAPRHDGTAHDIATSYAIGEAMVATAVVTTFLVRLARYVYGHGRSFSSRGCRSAASPRAHTGNRHQHGRGEDVVGATNRLLPETFQWCSIAGVAPLSRDVRAPTAPSSISPSWVATTAERAVIAITRNERAEPEPRSRCRVWHPVESVHHHADPWQRAMDSTSDTRNERVEPEQ